MDSNTQPQYSENNNQVWECLPTTSNYVDQIAFSPDGKIVASFHRESTEPIKLWDVATGQQLYTANFADLQEIDREIDFLFCKSLFFSPNGNNLACIGFIWDLALGKAVSVKALKSPFERYQWKNVALSPDLQIAVSIDKDAGIIKLWETSSGKEIHTLSVGDNAWDIYINQFSPDGKIFASLTWLDPYVVEKTETIKLWEVETGKELCSILVPRVTAESKYTGVIALSSDGQILASNSQDNNSGHYDQKTVIVLSETLTGKEICRFPKFLEWEEFVAKKLAEEESVEKKSVGLKKFISSAFNKFLLIFSPNLSKQLLKSLELEREFISIKVNKVVSLAFSPNDQFLASGYNDGTITLWQLKKGSSEPPVAIQTFTHVSKQPIKTLAFSPDGQTLATGHGDNDGGITLWDVNSGKKIKTFAGHVVSAARLCCNAFIDCDEVAVSPDGNMIASSGDNDMIRLWHRQTGAFLRSFESKSHPGSAKKITFSRDGKFLVSVYRTDIVLWEVSTGREIQAMIPDPDADNSYSRRWGSRYLNQYGDLLAISEKSTSFDGAKLQIKVLQVPNGETVCTLIGNYQFPSQIIFSPDKRLVATRHNMSEFGIWELATGKLIRNINTDYAEGDTDPGDPDPVLFSPDGEILAIAGTANITLWQVSSGEKIQTINRYHQGWGSCLAFHPNGQILAFSGSDSTDSIKLWDIKTGSEICILQETLNRVTSLDFSGNGEVLVSSYRDGTISVWQQKRV
jgi:WD40 repeat protein